MCALNSPSCRGSGYSHHLGHGDDEHVRTPKLVAGLSKEKVIMVAVGAHHVLTLSESGNVHGWGKNSSEEVDESGEGVSLPKLVPEASNQGVIYIACGLNEVRAPFVPEIVGCDLSEVRALSIVCSYEEVFILHLS